MSNISEIKLPDDNVYELKDKTARDTISKIKDIIDINEKNETLVFNVGGNRKRLIFNTDKTVYWENADTFINLSYVESETITIGDPVIIYGKAIGGKAPYTYSYYYKQIDTENWTTEQVDTDSESVSINFENQTDYIILVIIKDSLGNISEKMITLNIVDALVNDSTVSATNITINDSITVTGKVSGGASPYKYKFEARHSTSVNYTVLQDFTSLNTGVWTPTRAGTHYIRITVKDKIGKTESKWFTILVEATKMDSDYSIEMPNIVDGTFSSI